MIKLIVGKEGSGKTQALIEDANEAVKKTKGHIVFIDTHNTNMFQIDYKIRFMSLKDYTISSEDEFYGFLCGISASNYDTESIYIDELLRITAKPLEELKNFFEKLAILEMKYNINFIFTINNKSEELPEYLQKYIHTTLS
ncbi:MAG: ATP-binding protein [Clostridiaceae bacterium]|nr:ATP-binding protein [Clostridiaceae bacterium]